MPGDTGDVRDRLGKGRRIVELRVLAVGDEVAVVGRDRRSGFIGTDGEPQRCLCAEHLQRPRAPEPHDLDRHAPAQDRRAFAVVDDDDESRRGLRDDLLAHHRPSPSLDQPQCRVDAIRAVDRDVEAVSSQFLDRHAVLRRKRGTRKRGRDGADPQALPYAFRKPQDEPARSRARAETHAHAVRHQRHCGFSRSAAGRLDVHPCRVAVRMPGVCSALPPWCGPAARAAVRRAVA